MDDFRERLVALLHHSGMTWNTVLQFIKKDPSLQTAIHDEQRFFQYNLFPPSTNTIIKSSPSITSNQLQYISQQIEEYEKNNIKVITIFDENYPSLLKEIYQPPWVLFIKGDLTLLEKQPKLAVVGSREATQYGKNAISVLFPPLIEKGVAIVSGLARGIDTLAHECAMKNGGKTIAVIAGGLYHIYPKENAELAKEMMKSQLVISEYPPDTKPLRWHFPARNRIISGLSNGTFIIEAKRKSGSLITANYAVHEGREVFSLPGSIFSQHSLGTNDLIKQGAKLVMSSEDILEELHL
ncbi:DNA-processing protein DprA [Neobacillus niacini]|uniref:DNA-processing protein DprA n=1 Tax=Neobacillus niacini TaxID=86668 RepID=UPI00052FD3A4|nr:DNA-processing protein DprA [Neobacillus niacini]KGM45314.1 DNA processing protein DprA [Neobacillus niacini]MEC1520870.1 DNA-processing protein DprA [Neobacillus niacini]